MQKGKFGMEAKEIFKLLVGALPEIVQILSKTYGVIHKQTQAEINGVQGFLIWDYILFNEITFKDMNENIYSLFKSADNSETEKKWDELEKKYGV